MSRTHEPSKKKPNKKFRHTRELIRIAMNDGMTQGEIADLCRTQQSRISEWANGKGKAPVHIVERLIKKYGHRLNRVSSRIYRVRREPEVPWEETEEGRAALPVIARYAGTPNDETDLASSAVADFNAELAAACPQLGSVRLSPASAAQVLKESYRAGPDGWQTVRVEGRIVFQHLFEEISELKGSGSFGRDATPHVRRRPIRRWAVHDQGAGQLRLVRSDVLVLVGTALGQWVAEVTDFRLSGRMTRSDAESIPEVYSRDEAGRWISEVDESCDAANLIERAEELLRDESIHDQMTVPFLLRKALVVAGHDVPGVVTLPAAPG